jgi:hypothetical protein
MMILKTSRANLSSNDQLSLDLPFAATKSLTARVGPTPTFTRASTGTFVGSNGLIQSAAINIPRFDHDPITLACKGLLIEESRTNLIQRSDDFGNAYWIKLRSTITSDTTTSPSGATDADKLVEDTSSNTHIVYRLVNVGVTTPVSFSVFAKASERSWIQLECGDNFTAGSTAYFNLSNGTIGTVGAGATASIQSMGNGWYRCVVVATPTATTSNGFYVNIATANGTRSYAGNGTSGVFIWGAQVEAGSFPTSYIPTTTASVVRSADVCSITGGNFTSFYNQSEGAFLMQSIKTSTNANSFIYHVCDGSFNNGIDNRHNSATIVAALMNVSNVNQLAGMSTVTVTAGSSVKQSFAYKLNDCAYSVNGATPILDASALIPTVSQITIGNAFSGNFHLNGTIAAVRYYRKRLPNAKLQALTV